MRDDRIIERNLMIHKKFRFRNSFQLILYATYCMQVVLGTTLTNVSGSVH